MFTCIGKSAVTKISRNRSVFWKIVHDSWRMKSKYLSIVSRTGFQCRRMCMQRLLPFAKQGRINCIRNFSTEISETHVSKEKRSDLRRLFGLARPEAFRITGMVV